MAVDPKLWYSQKGIAVELGISERQFKDNYIERGCRAAKSGDTYNIFGGWYQEFCLELESEKGTKGSDHRNLR